MLLQLYFLHKAEALTIALSFMWQNRAAALIY